MKRRQYRRGFWQQASVAGGLAIVLAGVLSGCATLRTVDSLPAGAAKGYVVFYGEATGKQAVDVPTVSVRDITDCRHGGGYSLTLIRQKDHGQVPAWRALGSKYLHKVACTPGKHLFRVEIGTTATQADVDVAAGMITPVRLELNTIIVNDILAKERVFFALSANADQPAKPPLKILDEVVE